MGELRDKLIDRLSGVADLEEKDRTLQAAWLEDYGTPCAVIRLPPGGGFAICTPKDLVNKRPQEPGGGIEETRQSAGGGYHAEK